MIRKFTNTEGNAVPVSPKDQRGVESDLNKIGKTSASELSGAEREKILGNLGNESDDLL